MNGFVTSSGPVFPLELSDLLLEVVALKYSKLKSHYNIKINRIT